MDSLAGLQLKVEFDHVQVVFTISSLRALQLSHFNEERNCYELLPDALDLDRQKLTLMLPLHKATNVINLELRGHCLN